MRQEIIKVLLSKFDRLITNKTLQDLTDEILEKIDKHIKDEIKKGIDANYVPRGHD